MRVKGGKRLAGRVGKGKRIAITGSAYAGIGEATGAVHLPGNTEGVTGTPRNDGIETPTLCKALGPRGPRPVKGQVPAAAEGDAVTQVEIRRSAKQAGIVSRNLAGAGSGAEAGRVVNGVRVGITEYEVSSADAASVG